MCDCTESIREAHNLFGFIDHLAIFFGDSYKSFGMEELHGQTQSWLPKVTDLAETRDRTLVVKGKSSSCYLWK